MGAMVGHVSHGFGFFIIGLWHLLNHIRLHSLSPKSYTYSLPWFPFPSSRFKYLELFLITAGSAASIFLELFVGPAKHHPLDTDGTIPTNHLPAVEHSNMSTTFFTYALLSIVLDKLRPPAQAGLNQMLGAIVFGQELLLFHLHSADHMRLESQYHRLLQIVIFVSLLTTLLGIGHPRSFLNNFIRSLSILFQGVWLMVLGVMLWTPELIPKGCSLNWEEGRRVVRCHSSEAIERAKSLVNIEFSWYLIGVTIFAVSLYLGLFKLYAEEKARKYQSLSRFEDADDDEVDDVEAQKSNNVGELGSFLPVRKSFEPADFDEIKALVEDKRSTD